MSAGGRIRDPVHGYIRFTRVERRLIDDPVVQRLRYIGQAGLSHLVFPEVRTSRFGHSLGAMHLASRFLSAALENADKTLRAQMEGLMDEAISQATGGFRPRPDDVVQALTEDGLRAAASVSDVARSSALLLEQGLRLAGLVHDLGHLPFSHDFEYALQRLFEEHRSAAESEFPALTSQGDLAIHERIGYRMARTLVRKIFDHVPDRFEADLARTTFSIAEKILRAEPPPDPGLAVAEHEQLDVDALWWWLHSLMSGEIDVDRCDYLLRDARTYGFEFASYDLERLVSHLTVVRPQPDRNALETAVLPQGISAVESFYLARYRAYTWGPFHHKVSQIAAALQQSILLVLGPAFIGGGPQQLRRFLEDIEQVAGDESCQLHTQAPDLLDRFRRYDDGWMMRYIRDASEGKCTISQQAWLDLVCWRTPGPKSLWKRSSEFPVDLLEFNEALPNRDDPSAAARWRLITDQLAHEGVLVIRHHFSPYKLESGSKESRIKVSGPGGKLRPLTDISPMTAALPDLWNADVQVFASALKPPDQLAGDVVARLQQASRPPGGTP
jgi:HD superfamily phosphohydrolase